MSSEGEAGRPFSATTTSGFTHVFGCIFDFCLITLGGNREVLLRRFFIDEIDTGKDRITIRGPEARHMLKVLRMVPGDSFILMDGRGKRYQAFVEATAPLSLDIRLERPLRQPPPSPVNITLCQALLKSRLIDTVIQKTSELGIDRVCPFVSRRTVVRLESKRLEKRLRHWREVARNSAKQSGRRTPAEILFLPSLERAAEQFRAEEACKVILWEDEESLNLKSLLRAHGRLAASFIGVVGPEGGFEQEEVEVLKSAGFTAVSMGNRVLRAETAAISVTALVQYEWGDLCSD